MENYTTEKEYIVNNFIDHLGFLKDEKLAIYGIGRNTQYIIDNCNNWNIDCLLDGYQNEGTMYGKDIVDIHCLLQSGTKNIVIIARPSSTHIIARRIEEICKSFGIKVFDIHGNTILEHSSKVNISCQYTHLLDKEKIKREIEKSEVVSFDIFDTLLMRLYGGRENLLYYVAMENNLPPNEFVDSRMKAELMCTVDNPSLRDIYLKMVQKGDLPQERIEGILQSEIDFEKDNLSIRHDVYELYAYAKNIGKTICLVSDMYLSKTDIKEILDLNNISGYDHLLVSSEEGTGKRQNLFELMKQKSNKRYYCASMHGIKNYVVYNPGNFIEVNKIILGAQSNEEKIIESLVLSKLLTKMSVSSDGKINFGQMSVYELGFCIIAPILIGYMNWMLTVIKKGDFDKILFLARDGYLVCKMYEMYVHSLGEGSNMPQSSYFYFSRTAGISLLSDNEVYHTYAKSMAYYGEKEDLLSKRFINSKEKLKEQKENFYDYLNKQIKDSKNIAIIDFVSTGTCQMCIEELTGLSCTGLYFMRLAEDFIKKKSLNIYSYCNVDKCDEKIMNLEKYYLLIETMIKSGEGTVEGYESHGMPVLKIDSRSERQIEYLNELQNGVIDFYRYFLKFTKNRIGNINLKFTDSILGLVEDIDFNNSSSDFIKFTMKDEFCNREIKFGDFFVNPK